MITNYDKYQYHVAVEMLKDKFESELSKYLEVIESNDLKTTYDFEDNKDFNDVNKIFLLDKDYGARISNISYIYQLREYVVTLNSVKFKSFNRFVDGKTSIKVHYNTYKDRDSTIEEFVKKFVDKLKEADRIRKLQVANRELKKNMHKYNI
jgi:hypothetical protein